MKKLLSAVLVSLAFLLGNAQHTVAQATAAERARPTQEQSLQELVREVRELRKMLQGINRTNLVVERLKFQQELVTRNSRELTNVREGLEDARIQIAKMKEMARRGEADAESGSMNPKELSILKLELDTMIQREMRLLQRESQLVNDLSVERSKLIELNDELVKLELELR